MPPRRQQKRPIESYEHRDKERLNNPPVGLVTPDTDKDAGKKTYEYDPHLDPQLQWAGKAEHTSFEVPTVSLHVHERIDPRTIIEATRKRNGNGAPQIPLFEAPEENPPVRDAIEFYKHRHNWSNRLISGDSLLVMNSLLEKEGMAGKVQMIYIDPPYGIRYGSNFQPFVNDRAVRDGRDEDLAQTPEMIKAFRDTWELGIHSYLSYLRDRLLLARELLSESGSVFVQISDENVHRVRSLMDEVFGSDNFVSQIPFLKTTGKGSNYLDSVYDTLIWYSKDRDRIKYNTLFHEKQLGSEGTTQYVWADISEGRSQRRLTKDELHNANSLPEGTRVFAADNLTSQSASATTLIPFEYEEQTYRPGKGGWKTNLTGLSRLSDANRLMPIGKSLMYKRYLLDFPVYPINNIWRDTLMTGFSEGKVYVVQTSLKVIQRCILMTTDPGDLVLDPTCGSGTTAYAAEHWGRRWITCDTSRVAISLAKQRLMTGVFDFYELAHPNEGVSGGFAYRTVPHVTLRSIANNPDIREGMSREEIDDAIARHSPQEILYDQPLVDRSKKRVTGPFSVEAVPAPSVTPIDEVDQSEPATADVTIARSDESLRQSEWRDELLRTGIRGKLGQFIRFARLEPLPGSPGLHDLHADGESMPNDDGSDSLSDGAASFAQRIVVSFGPEHAPLEQRQVERAIEEAHTLVPRPKMIVFAAFQFDPEAAKDIDETNWPGMTFLKAQMNPDLLTEDLKKKRASNESFWLVGQPDVYLHLIRRGPNTGKYQIQVRGFDYYNTKTGGVESGGEDRIALWMLDTDYDGRSLYPQQVFFPMSGARDGWSRLARNLRVEIDEDLIEAYRGTTSLPFEMGENQRVAVKIVDDRGIESLRVVSMQPKTSPKEPSTEPSIDDETSPTGFPKGSIEERIENLFADVPQEERDRLPADLIDNLDHYLYGTEKR